MNDIGLLSNVSITCYEDERGCIRDIWIEEPENKNLCEYKTVIDNPPDSSEREICSISYMKHSEYKKGIDELVDSGRCEIPLYDNDLSRVHGTFRIELKGRIFFCDGMRTGFKLDDLLGKYCQKRGLYYR